MIKKSFALSIALHVSVFTGVLFWMLHHKEPIKPKVVPISIVNTMQLQQPQVQKLQELPKPKEIPVAMPTSTPLVKTTPTQKPSPLPIQQAQLKPLEAPIVKKQELVKEQPKTEPQELQKPKELPVQKTQSLPPVDTKKVQEAYLAYVHQSANKLKIYPKNAKRLSQEGVAYVHFVILRDGTISNISLQKSSGFALLDDAAVKIITALAKLKPIPRELAKEQYDIVLPIDYSLE
jgi:protein TonB